MTPERRRTWHAWAIPIAIVAVVCAVPMVSRLHSTGRVSDRGPDDTLVASIRSEPRSFNRYVSRDLSSTVLTFLMHASLVHVNRVTDVIEPELAERWELLPDRRTYRLWLRPDVRFSDGAPFSSDDVAFSFQAIYDRRVGSVLADSLEVGDQPLVVRAEGPLTVTVRFPVAFGPGLRMLDGVPIYPRHLLEAAFKADAFRSAWTLATPPAEIAGLGPFVLRRYEPGQRLILDRNPLYWRSDSHASTLAHLVLEIVPDQDAELLGLETGRLDLTQSELRPVDVPALKQAVGAGRVHVADAGTGMDGDLLWLNLTAAKAHDPRSRWLQDPDFRRAIAHAVDRRAFVDTVYFGQAVPADGIVSPGNAQWHAEAPFPTYDPTRAKELVARLGLSTGHGGATLEDRDGRAVRFTLLTQKGNSSLERGASVVRESLAAVGIQVDVVGLEPGALVDAVTKGNYDAAYFRLLTTDSDPSLNLDFWLSSGSAHVWNPNQPAPATPWEARIDALMGQLSSITEPQRRRELFAEVQQIVADEVPVLCFAFPRMSIAVSARVADATPAAYRPPLLWNPAVINVRSAR